MPRLPAISPPSPPPAGDSAMSAPAQVVPALFGKDGSLAASRPHRARPLPSPSPASGGLRHRAQRAGSEWPLGPDRLRLRRQRQDLHLPAVHAHGRARRAGAEWPLRPSRLRRGRRRRDLHLSAARVRDPARHAGAEWPQSGLASDGDAEIFASPPGALRTELGVQAPVGLLGPAGFFAGGNAEVFISRLLALKTELITEAPSGLLGPDGFAADGNADFFIFGCARSGPSSARRRRVASWTRPACRGRQRRALHLPAVRGRDRARELATATAPRSGQPRRGDAVASTARVSSSPSAVSPAVSVRPKLTPLTSSCSASASSG